MPLDFTIGFPVRNRIAFANEAIQCILDNCDYPIIIIDDNSNRPDAEYLHHPRVRVIYNQEKKSLTALWNQILKASKTEYVILAGDKLRPKEIDFALIEEKLLEGFGLVGTYMLGIFGFSKYLTTKIGLFDEGFKANGYEDTDTMNKLFMNDIALYFSKETEYIQIGSGWQYNPVNQAYYNIKWIEDWDGRQLIQIKDDENFHEKDAFMRYYNNGIQYLPWSKSELKDPNIQGYYRNLKAIKK